MSKKYFIIIILLGVSISGLYGNILFNKPVNWDDPALINNPKNYELNSVNLKRIFTITSAGTFQPVRDFSYMIDHAFMPRSVVDAIHIHSIILYIFMSIAAWLFLLALFRVFSVEDNKAFFWASVAALIYAVHPVHVESVAWLYARKEPLLGLFAFMSLWAFVKARATVYHPTFTKGVNEPKGRLPGWTYLLLSFVFLILAILSKPTAFVLPAFMAVIDVCLQLHNPRQDYWKKRVIFLLAAFAIVISMSIWLITMMAKTGGIKFYHGGTFFTNLLAVSQIFIEYVLLYASTVYFSADYPIKLFTSISDRHAWVYITLNIGLICFAVFSLIKKWFIPVIFIAMHYIFILPVSHIFPINNILQDRYALLPSLSWCVLAGWMITALWFKRLKGSRFSENFTQLIAAAIMIVIVASYSYMTFMQTFVWRNSAVLWEHVLKKYPNSSSANVNMSALLIDTGQYDTAIQLCFAAVIEKPYDYLAISNMALAQMGLHQYKDALHNFRVALDLKPDLANAKIGMATCYLKMSEYEKAYEILNPLVSRGEFIKAGFSDLLYTRSAYVSWKTGRKSQAETLMKAVKFERTANIEVLGEIATTVTSMGNTPLAISAYKKLLSELKSPELETDIKAKIKALEEQKGSQGKISRGKPSKSDK